MFSYKTLDSTFRVCPAGRRILRSFSIRLAVEPFLPTLLIAALVSVGTFSPVLCQEGPAAEWHLLYLKIRDSQISKEEALTKLKSLESLLKNHNIKSSDGKLEDCLGFPLRGYDPSAIGGKGRSGYQPEGYDFFDGNRHKGHPGHDIFIRDKN